MPRQCSYRLCDNGHQPDGLPFRAGHEPVLLRGICGGRTRTVHTQYGILPAGRRGTRPAVQEAGRTSEEARAVERVFKLCDCDVC